MLYTLTLNPAIDYHVCVDNLVLGETNRTQAESFQLGGKGINVSQMLANLDMENIALGIVCGPVGKILAKNIPFSHDFVYSPLGNTRINIKIHSNQETEINAAGCAISDPILNKFYKKIKTINSNDTLIICGSAPKNLTKSIYSDIISALKKDVRVVVDTTDELLLNTLKHKPFLIKPNLAELESIFNTKAKNSEDIIILAKKLQALGAQNVLISLGARGAILLTGKNIYAQSVPNGHVVNTIGSGDSMLAAFIYNYDQTANFKSALKFAVSAGSATAFTAGIATKEDISSLLSSF